MVDAPLPSCSPRGITFSFLAAELMAAMFAGGSSPLFDDLAIDRDIPG
ncbi:hypothetical protein [Bradyrhizobium elkanii]|uniref:Uncharacterized protein n=1 Tax=Bradyrhizobium elkanii TaxID=29448 RepID=A0A8I1Y4H4_BRAEL|nr:hypothetical protein [Bradyrhizobium elkanii]MBP1294454.1 hypothetical protein [Bradyrhizobium elkanii]